MGERERKGVPVLGITDGQTSGAAVVVDGRLVSAINEERIVRVKMARGFPRRSIAEALKPLALAANLQPQRADYKKYRDQARRRAA